MVSPWAEALMASCRSLYWHPEAQTVSVAADTERTVSSDKAHSRTVFRHELDNALISRERQRQLLGIAAA
jgi:hypothetical protein